MKLLKKLKLSVRNSLALGAFAAAVLTVGLGASGTAVAANGADCGVNHNGGNAVINCGGDASQIKFRYNHGDGLHSADSIHDIYSWFGISPQDVNNLSNAKAGKVTASGDVIVNGHVVASNVFTAGRHDIQPGSTAQHSGGTTFYTRHPSVSFLSGSLPALVVMQNGQFQFAILTDCGNPVAKFPIPHPKPSYNVEKTVSVKGTHDFDKNVTVAPGTHVYYKVKVSNTGGVDLKDILVNDNLPAHVQYINNTLTRDGNKVSNDNAFFGNGIKINLNAHDSTVFEFEAIVGPNATPQHCTTETLDNEAVIHHQGLPNDHSHAKVNKQCEQTVACESLDATTSDDVTFNFKATADAQHGATINGYKFDFGDGNSKTVNGNTISHTYTQSGTFTTKVTVLATVNGKDVQVTSDNCQTVVKPKITPPTFACDSLTADQQNRTTFTFNTKAHASGGATIVGYNYDFGDGHSATNAGASVSHTYTAAGTYNVSAQVQVKVNGKVQLVDGAACKTTVTVKPAPLAECTDLTAQIGANQDVTATATYTTKNASLTSASFNWGDNSAATAGTNNAAASKVSASHTYATTGNFTIVATLKFTTTNGQTITDTCQTPVNFQAQPTFACDNLTVSADSDHNVTITGFQTSASNGAVFTQADISWGDSTSTTTNSVVGQQHQYGSSVTSATITATAHFTVNGQDVTATSPNCVKQVSFTTTTCKPCESTPTPPGCVPPSGGSSNANCTTTPTTLVNTGPGSIAAIFAGASAIGTLIYRQVLRRRLTE